MCGHIARVVGGEGVSERMHFTSQPPCMPLLPIASLADSWMCETQPPQPSLHGGQPASDALHIQERTDPDNARCLSTASPPLSLPTELVMPVTGHPQAIPDTQIVGGEQICTQIAVRSTASVDDSERTQTDASQLLADRTQSQTLATQKNVNIALQDAQSQGFGCGSNERVPESDQHRDAERSQRVAVVPFDDREGDVRITTSIPADCRAVQPGPGRDLAAGGSAALTPIGSSVRYDDADLVIPDSGGTQSGGTDLCGVPCTPWSQPEVAAPILSYQCSAFPDNVPATDSLQSRKQSPGRVPYHCFCSAEISVCSPGK